MLLQFFTRTTFLLAYNFAPNWVHLEMLKVTSSIAPVGAGFTSSVYLHLPTLALTDLSLPALRAT